MAARGGALPALNDAVEQMQSAIKALDMPELSEAVTSEQQALANLIRARQNVRKMLSQSSSQSASACRKFDREQRQKLRLPEKKKDQQQQLADARSKLDDLAKRERKWSEQAQQSCSRSSSKSASPAPSKPAQSQQSEQSEQNESQTSESPSQAEVAADQEKMQAELAEIQKQLEKLDAAGKAAGEQAQQAAQSMQQGLDELQKQDGEAAAKDGRRSAEQLEQLSAHLAAMGARDFGQRLDHAQKLAQQLASRQESLEKQLGSRDGNKEQSQTSQASNDKGGQPQPSSDSQVAQSVARDERTLAAQTELLADLLDVLKRDAATEKGGVKQKLDQVQAENPPREIAAGMRQAANDLQAERKVQAGRAVAEARERLNELSRSLATARSEYAQPQLKELIALEEQLAQLIEQAKHAHEQSQKAASAGQKWSGLEKRLDALAAGDRRLAEALRQLRAGPQAKPQPTPFVEGGQPPPDGFYPGMELGDFSGIREVSKALQAKIQEAILAGALMDANQPVPPTYKKLVEEYYRVLSDDLRQ